MLIKPKIDASKTIQKINKTNNEFFEEIVTDKPLVYLIQRKTEKTQISSVRVEREDITPKNITTKVH